MLLWWSTFLFIHQLCQSQVTHPLTGWTRETTPAMPDAAATLFTGYEPSTNRIWLVGYETPSPETTRIWYYDLDTPSSSFTDVDRLETTGGSIYTLGTVNAQCSSPWGDHSIIFASAGFVRQFLYNEGYDANLGGFNSEMPNNREAPCVVTVYPDYVFAVGGRDTAGQETADFQIFDNSLSTPAWMTSVPNLRDGRARHACVVANNYLYAFGGSYYTSGGTQYARTTSEKIYVGSVSNIASYSWSNTVDYAAGSNVYMHRAVLHTLYNQIYLVGGRDSIGGDASDFIQIYDIASNTAQIITSYPLNTGRSSPAAIMVNNKLYVFGGSNDAGNGVFDDWEYSNTLTFVPTKIPTASPTRRPTVMPSMKPTKAPITQAPTTTPPTTSSPTSAAPTSQSPTTAEPTSSAPTTAEPTIYPTTSPTNDPTQDPTVDPSTDPTADPTSDPSTDPTSIPSTSPTKRPSVPPTETEQSGAINGVITTQRDDNDAQGDDNDNGQFVSQPSNSFFDNINNLLILVFIVLALALLWCCFMVICLQYKKRKYERDLIGPGAVELPSTGPSSASLCGEDLGEGKPSEMVHTVPMVKVCSVSSVFNDHDLDGLYASGDDPVTVAAAAASKGPGNVVPVHQHRAQSQANPNQNVVMGMVPGGGPGMVNMMGMGMGMGMGMNMMPLQNMMSMPLPVMPLQMQMPDLMPIPMAPDHETPFDEQEMQPVLVSPGQMPAPPAEEQIYGGNDMNMNGDAYEYYYEDEDDYGDDSDDEDENGLYVKQKASTVRTDGH